MPEAVLLVLEGLPPTFTSEELKRLCQPYGSVVFAKVVQESLEPSLEQLGFVRMETVEQAEQLVDHLHERHIGTHTVKVTPPPNEPS